MFSYTSKTCRFHLRNISRIRKYIPQDTSVGLVKSLVMSRLDYTNGLFYGLPKCTVSGLQAVQNSAARSVTQERIRDHDSMSRSLIGLHWLPVDKKIEYTYLLILLHPNVGHKAHNVSSPPMTVLSNHLSFTHSQTHVREFLLLWFFSM